MMTVLSMVLQAFMLKQLQNKPKQVKDMHIQQDWLQFKPVCF